MGVFTSQNEIVSPLSPAQLFKGLVVDAFNVFAKASPNTHKGGEILEGDGGPGSIKKFIFTEGYAKMKVDVFDTKNYVYSYTIIEGNSLLSDNLEKISNEWKYVAAPNGGSIIKSTHKYYTKNDVQLSEEDLQAWNQQIVGFVKLVEAYLLANPDYFN